jgi:hypothetical protein
MKDPQHHAHQRTILLGTLFLGVSLGVGSLHALPEETNSKVIASSEGTKAKFEILTVLQKEAGWNELDRTDKETGKRDVLFKDQVLMTTSVNSGTGIIPEINQKELAEQYAQYLIKQAGGRGEYQKEINKMSSFNIPAPTGLLADALSEAGIDLPSNPSPSKGMVTPIETSPKEKSRSMEF